jgi:hypothetical protein
MKSLITCVAISVLSLAVATGSLAAGRGGSTGAMQNSTAPTAATHKGQPTTLGPSHATGQPNQSCETTPNTPGNAANAPGSAFNPTGRAGSVYAGEQPQNSRNSVSVSQYDAACARPSR